MVKILDLWCVLTVGDTNMGKSHIADSSLSVWSPDITGLAPIPLRWWREESQVWLEFDPKGDNIFRLKIIFNMNYFMLSFSIKYLLTQEWRNAVEKDLRYAILK